MILKLVSFLLILHTVQCARILGFFVVPSISHQSIYQPIWKELARRGHDVTVISPNILGENITNLKEIDIGHAYDVMIRGDVTSRFSKSNSLITITYKAFELFQEIIEDELNNPEVQKIIKGNGNEFDLILVEALTPLVFGFAGKYRVPVVGICSLVPQFNGHDAVGNPTHPVASPDFFVGMTDEESTFQERMKSFLYNIYYRYTYYTYWLPRYDQFLRQYFGNHMPYLGDLERNISLMLTNISPVLQTVRPNVPAVVEVSQLHIKPKKPLPSDLKKYLDEATEGFVYFSLGSNVKSANLKIEIRQAILEALGDLPYKVLWKWEADHLPNKPQNVKISKWLPQQDVLGHPNIKAFISQGGIQSIEESLSNGVPMVIIPFMGDQPMNAKKLVKKGVGIYVDFETISKDILKQAIIEIATDKKYKEKAVELGSILTDVPMKGLDKAIWWIEYVLRHKGAKHIVSPTRDMPYWKYFCLDVISFLLVLISVTIFIVYKVLRKFLRYILNSRKKLKKN